MRWPDLRALTTEARLTSRRDVLVSSLALSACTPVPGLRARASFERLADPGVRQIAFAGGEWGLQSAGRPWSVQVSSQWPQAIRFECRPGDRWFRDPASRERAELSGGGGAIAYGRPVWISFSRRVWLPASGEPEGNVVLGQVHRYGRPRWEVPAHPLLAFRLRRGDEEVITTSGSVEAPLRREPEPGFVHQGPFSWNRWIHYVVRAVFHPVAGELDIWRNGRQITEARDVQMGFVEDGHPYFKFGIYRAASSDILVAEYANVVIGTESLRRLIRDPSPVPN